MDIDQDPLQSHVRSSQSDVEMQPVYWKDSVDEDLRAAVMSVVGRDIREAQPSPTQTTRSSRLLLESPITRRPRRSVLSSHPYSPSHLNTSTGNSTHASTSYKRPRRMRSLPQPIQSGVAKIEGGDVPGPSRSKSEPEMDKAGEPQGSVEGERLDRLIYQVQARLQERQLVENGIACQKIMPNGKGSQSSTGKSPQKRSGTAKPTTTHISAPRSSTSIIPSLAITPSRVLRDRTKQDLPTAQQTTPNSKKELLGQKMVTRGQPRELAVNRLSERERRPNDSAKKNTMKTTWDKAGQVVLPKSSRSPGYTFGPIPTETPLAIKPQNEENTKATALHPTESARANVRRRGYAVDPSPRGLRLSIKPPAQGLGSQAKRPHTFKTPFLNKPQSPTEPAVESEIPADDVEMGGPGNESFDSMDMDAMFLEGGEEVEALLRAYDG